MVIQTLSKCNDCWKGGPLDDNTNIQHTWMYMCEFLYE